MDPDGIQLCDASVKESALCKEEAIQQEAGSTPSEKKQQKKANKRNGDPKPGIEPFLEKKKQNWKRFCEGKQQKTQEWKK